MTESPTKKRKALKMIGGKMMLKNNSGSNVAESPTENRKALKMIGGKMMLRTLMMSLRRKSMTVETTFTLKII